MLTRTRMTALSALTLTALLAACGGTNPPVGNLDPTPGASGDPVPAQLQGEWHYGYISPIEYYSPSTGQYAEASGTSVILKLTADGRFQRSGISVISTSGCTSKILLNESGVVDLDGSTLTLIPTTSHSKGYNCTPSNSWEQRKPVNSVSTWSVTGSGASAVLTLGDPSGKATDSRYNRPRGATTPGGDAEPGQLRGVVRAASSTDRVGKVSVFACPASGTCEAGGSKFRFTQPGDVGTSSDFTIEDVSDEPHNVFAWTDVNRNSKVDVGDMYGVYTADGKSVTPVTPPADGLEITVYKLTPDDLN